MPCGVTYSTGISRYRPCHGPPMKWTVMVSFTLTEESGRTAISALNRWMRSSLAERGKERRSKEAMRQRKKRREIPRFADSARNDEARDLFDILLRRGGGGVVEADFGGFAFGGGTDFEKFTGLEAKHAGENVGRELLNFGIEVAHDGIVVAAGVLHGVFNLGEGILQRREAFDGAKLGGGFGEGEGAFKGAGGKIF